MWGILGPPTALSVSPVAFHCLFCSLVKITKCWQLDRSGETSLNFSVDLLFSSCFLSRSLSLCGCTLGGGVKRVCILAEQTYGRRVRSSLPEKRRLASFSSSLRKHKDFPGFFSSWPGFFHAAKLFLAHIHLVPCIVKHSSLVWMYYSGFTCSRLLDI